MHKNTIIVFSERPYVIYKFNAGYLIRVIKKCVWFVGTVLGKSLGSYYPSHATVSKEIIEGLYGVGCQVVMDPIYIGDFKRVLILAHQEWVQVLSKVYGNAGEARRLVCGPNVLHSLISIDTALFSGLCVQITAPSQWVVNNYIQQAPLLKQNIKLWPCGVDVDYWGVGYEDRNKIIIYSKLMPVDYEMVEEIRRRFKKYGIETRVVEYGDYMVSEWKNLLSSALLVVYDTSITESQGIAQFEAWAMDVPVFVRQVTECDVDGWKYVGATSSPYLSDQSGAFWIDKPELFALIGDLLSGRISYSPRQYVLDNFTRELKTAEFVGLFD